MAFTSSASAGPNAAPNVSPFSADAARKDASVAAPAPPLLHQRHYPPAQPMFMDAPAFQPNNSAVLLELAVQYDMPTLNNNEPCSLGLAPGTLYTTCRATAATTFFRPQMPLYKIFQASEERNVKDNEADEPGRRVVAIPDDLVPYVSLFDQRQMPLWSVTSKDWYTMTLVSSAQDLSVTLSTSSPPSVFSFAWTNGHSYYWRPVPTDQQGYDLRCYDDDKRTVVAELTQEGSRFVLWSTTATSPPIAAAAAAAATATTTTDESKRQSNSNNPFRSLSITSRSSRDETAFTSFLVLSALLIHDHLSWMLRSLGGGADAIRIVTDTGFGGVGRHEEEEEDGLSVVSSSFYDEGRASSLYHPDQGLVPAGAITDRSVKSVELDPGMLRCWWGYGFWWTWCPCCMPGGWLDRLVIKCRWGLRRRKHNSSISRARQRRQRGWQHPDQY